jgi:hypothetical protein
VEDRLPENHLLRRMNVFVTVTLADLHKELKSYCSDIGRASIEPELMIRMLIVGYAEAAVLNCVSCFKLENASRMYSPNLVSCATVLDVKISQNRSKSLFDMF